MRRPIGLPPAHLLALVGAAVAVAGLSGCRPKYPACKTDDDCNVDRPASQAREYCVNQLCQQCRDDKDCKEGRACNKGRCDPIPGFCKDDAGCAEGEICVENRCKGCETDEQCPGGGKCRSGRCLAEGACATDDDCPEDQDCKKGRCVPAGPGRASQDAPCQLKTVFFDFNESALSTDATSDIDANAECLRKAGRPVTMIGRTDPRGTEEYNIALSERRAAVVRDRLIRLGIQASQLRMLAKGELEARGTDEAGWAQDRRVDFEWAR